MLVALYCGFAQRSDVLTAIILPMLAAGVLMRDSVMWFLISSLVLTSLFVVHVRHQHRIGYSAFQAEEDRRDRLNDEWGQLLIEENTGRFRIG